MYPSTFEQQAFVISISDLVTARLGAFRRSKRSRAEAFYGSAAIPPSAEPAVKTYKKSTLVMWSVAMSFMSSEGLKTALSGVCDIGDANWRELTLDRSL